MIVSPKFTRGLAAILALACLLGRSAADSPPAPAAERGSQIESPPPLPAPPVPATSSFIPMPMSHDSPPATPVTSCALPDGRSAFTLPDRGYGTNGKRRCRLCDPNAAHAAMMRVAPLGTSLHNVMATQIANGDAAQMVLYEYDFFPDDARLNCRGKVRLMKLARELSRTPFPILIQPTLVDPDLDEQRRAAVLAELVAFEPWVTDERVLIGFPPARGLGGPDAVLVHERLMELWSGGRIESPLPTATGSAAVPPTR